MYIEVELNTDEPTDRQQRANTAGQLVQWGYPKEWALEDLGITDPQKAIEQWWYEKFLEHEINMLMQKDQMDMQAAMQQAQQNAQMQAQMMMQAQQQQPPPEAIPGGEGFNPAAGGQSPINVNPSMQTRERVTGETRGGMPMAEGMP